MTTIEARETIQRVLTQAWFDRDLRLQGVTISVAVWTWGANDEYTWSVAPTTLDNWIEDVEFDQETLRAAFGDTPTEVAEWSFLA